MNISERIAEAVKVAENEASELYQFWGIPAQSPNAVYLGTDEAKELAVGTHAKVFSGAAQYVQGLRIIEVRLSNYLQVAYVEGVE